MTAAIERIITPLTKDLGGFTVGRILPSAKRRMVGPFIFLDHMGPADFAAGRGIDVRPHPHIGLATVTYLFEGAFIHRDTLGSHQLITPGAVNWMTAGRGIAHSERTGPDERAKPHRAHGLQSWVVLPREAEEMAPEFFHHPAASLPEITLPGARMRLIAGAAYGHASPVRIHSPLFYAEARMEQDGMLTLPSEYAERGLYLVEGSLRIADTIIAPHTMPVLLPGGPVRVEALRPSHFMMLGGEPLPELRYIEWNFVSSSKDRIEQAKLDWQARRFGTIPDDAIDYIPLPELSHER